MTRHALLAALVLLVGCSDPPDVMPSVKFLPADQLARYGCPDSTPCQPRVALYDPRTQTIVLQTGWDRTNENDISTLLHEFTHHLQWLSARENECPGDDEREAYATQIAWLRARGFPEPMRTMGTDAFTITTLTMCRRG